jgi:hypothetical protein
MNFAIGGPYSIVDATIVDIGTELSTVVLDGSPIGTPNGAAPAANVQAAATSDMSLTATSGNIVPGQIVAANGVLTNFDTMSHIYTLVAFGMNASGVSVPPQLSIPPGESVSFPVMGTVNSNTSVALVVYGFGRHK